MNRIERLFEDSLRHPWVVLDQRILKALRGLLSHKEQESADFPAAVVTGTKLFVICENPERLKEVILIDRQDPAKIYRRRLALKGEENSTEA